MHALRTLPDLRVHFGHFLQKTRKCSDCGATWHVYEEKMTDVNIAVQLLGDAQDDRFETAIIVSGDSDLAGPIKKVLRRYANKRIVVAFPPNRQSHTLRQVSSGAFTIGRDRLRRSQFPDTVVRVGKAALSRPVTWR